jgi:hypothetical protein
VNQWIQTEASKKHPHMPKPENRSSTKHTHLWENTQMFYRKASKPMILLSLHMKQFFKKTAAAAEHAAIQNKHVKVVL